MQSIANQMWAIVPAAGSGQRMNADRPKQYLPLGGQTVIDHTMEVILSESRVDKVLIGIQQNDTEWFQSPSCTHQRVSHYIGGEERANTVLNGINVVMNEHGGGPDDWVLVHDAARPCLNRGDLANLIDFCLRSDDGAILGTRLVDTVKRIDEQNQVIKTESREGLWRALTPQMFKLGELQEALEFCVQNQVKCTDEAQAMELSGYRVSVVSADPSNIKITHPNDLALANFYLQK